MGFLDQFIRHPQQLWLRRINLQIHLWAGLTLALYLVVIGFSGAILVFGSELGRLVDPSPWISISPNAPTAHLAQVIDNLRMSYPHTHIVSVMAPTRNQPVFIATLQAQPRQVIACHPVTGHLLGEVSQQSSRIGWIYDLHENLLARRTGRVVNGVAAALLLLIALTGLVNWWPGLQHWARALRIDFRRRWRRVNFDIHSAAGFWSFGFLVLWSISGVYFAWPSQSLLFINRLSPVINSRPPVIAVEREGEITQLDFDAMVTKAQSLHPGMLWEGIIFPYNRRSPFQILLSRSPDGGRDYEDTVFFNPYNGQYISTWEYGVKRSLGDWLIWLQVPLHFGTHWGFAVKVVWAAFGLALPLLAVTGVLMYWNRVLSKRWQKLKGERLFSQAS